MLKSFYKKNNYKFTYLHIINSLDIGGAEKVFFDITKSKKNILIISLTKKGFYGKKLIKKGYKVISLNMKKNIFALLKVIKLIFIINRYNPKVVHTWMYHSNLIGGIAAKLSGTRKVYWSVHHDYEYSNFLTFCEMKILTFLSFFIPNKIIFCSKSSKDNHLKNGYNSRIFYIIENGVSLKKYKPNKELRNKIRNKLGINDKCLLIGNISRYHPIKDHDTLLKSLSVLKSDKNLLFKCVLIGNGLSKDNIKLLQKIKDLNLENNIILYGKSLEIYKLLNAFDLYILSSKSECFPLTLLEAMACGIPCISTNVGDAKEMIGDSGWIIEPEDFKSLAESINNIIKNKFLLNYKSQLGINRVKNFYSLEKMQSQYKELYE